MVVYNWGALGAMHVSLPSASQGYGSPIILSFEGEFVSMFLQVILQIVDNHIRPIKRVARLW